MSSRDNNGEVIGALATTGDTNEVDDLCAIAGIRNAGFKTDDDFGASAPRKLNLRHAPLTRTPEKPRARPRPACRAERVLPNFPANAAFGSWKGTETADAG